MERNILIPIISFNLWNKQEITNFISRYLSRLSKQRPSSEPDQPSVQSDDIEDIAALNIKAEWIRRLQEILEQLEDMTLQTRAMAESAEMKATDEERIRVGQYIVNRILDYEALPTEAERTAAEKMVREITPYRGFYRKPVGQRSSLINGLLRDARKSEYSECISTLHLAEPIAELQRLNALYESLAEQREAKEKIKKESVTARDLADEAVVLINNMNDYANASSLLEPSDATDTFVRDIIKLYDSSREARNRRGGERDDADKPAGETPETPDDEQPSSGDETPETPDEENPDGDETPETPDEENPGGEEDDRPVVQ